MKIKLFFVNIPFVKWFIDFINWDPEKEFSERMKLENNRLKKENLMLMDDVQKFHTESMRYKELYEGMNKNS